MPAIWDSHFGFLAVSTGPAVAIGEWGGMLPLDTDYFTTLTSYMIAK